MINESAATDILFHYTTLQNLVNILNSNQFELTIGAGSVADDKNIKPYYLSLTRSRLGRYHVNRNNSGGVLMTLNGNKLNQRYRTKAIDYWDEDFRKFNGGAYEAEDRLFSNAPIISNARDYIVTLDILINFEHGLRHIREDLRRCLMLCAKYKIKYYFYANIGDWLIGNKGKSIKLNFEDLRNKVRSPFTKSPIAVTQTKTDYLRRLKQRKNAVSLFVNYIELFSINDYHKLSEAAQGLARTLASDRRSEALLLLKEKINEQRKLPVKERQDLDNFIATMLKAKLSFKNFFESIAQKWKLIIYR